MNFVELNRPGKGGRKDKRPTTADGASNRPAMLVEAVRAQDHVRVHDFGYIFPRFCKFVILFGRLTDK